MKHIKGNFFDVAKDYEVLVCLTNTVVTTTGRLVMGAGIAKEFRDRYPNIDFDWGQRTKSFGDNVLVSKANQQYLVAFPTKHHWKEKSSLFLIRKSAERLRLLADSIAWRNILLPRPGCGLGGLDWDKQVYPLLIQYLDDRFTVINNS